MTAMDSGDPAARFSIVAGGDVAANTDSTQILYYGTADCEDFTDIGTAIPAVGSSFTLEVGQVWSVNGNNVHAIGGADGPEGAGIADMSLVHGVHVIPRLSGNPVLATTPCFEVDCSANSNCSYSGGAVPVQLQVS